MSEKHIKEKKNLKRAEKIICCSGEQINAADKRRRRGNVFFLTTCLLSDHRFFCFKGVVVGHFAMF